MIFLKNSKNLVYCIDNGQENEYNISVVITGRRIEYAEYQHYHQNR